VAIAAQMEQAEVDCYKNTISGIKVKALNMVGDQLVHVKCAQD